MPVTPITPVRAKDVRDSGMRGWRINEWDGGILGKVRDVEPVGADGLRAVMPITAVGAKGDMWDEGMGWQEKAF